MRSISTTNNLFPCASHSSFSLQASHTFTMLPHLVVLRPCFVGILYPPFSTSSRYELQLLNVPFGSFIQIEKKSFSLTIFFLPFKKSYHSAGRIWEASGAEIPPVRPSLFFFPFFFSDIFIPLPFSSTFTVSIFNFFRYFLHFFAVYLQFVLYILPFPIQFPVSVSHFPLRNSSLEDCAASWNYSVRELATLYQGIKKFFFYKEDKNWRKCILQPRKSEAVCVLGS